MRAALSSSQPRLLGGRLAVDFANLGLVFSAAAPRPLSWNTLILFLEAAQVVSSERCSRLLLLPQSDPQSAEALLGHADRLHSALRSAFAAVVRKHRMARESVDAINNILRVTEGHDELVLDGGAWRLEFVARDNSPQWLLAAIARSAAEILSDQEAARLRSCANPACGLFFCDTSRTRKRRWCSMAACGNRHKVAAFARRRMQANG
jgi:predicted RNA-binding Zn ribbon-like protein